MEAKDLLKKARLETGMTQREFAQYFRIPLITYEQWERGKREITEYLLRLILFKVRIDKLAENITEDMTDELD